MHLSPPSSTLIVSCEHGGNHIPSPWQHVFDGASEILNTHRGYDPGALAIAEAIAQQVGAPLFAATVSRLLIDLNRSPGHPKLYSPWTRALEKIQRRRIQQDYYLPYRQAVDTAIRTAINQGLRVHHISVHSFTPELDGKVRQAELGLLYDPKRPSEKQLGRQLQIDLQSRIKQLKWRSIRIRRNYPYTGIQDGFIPWLRKFYSNEHYTGLELEFNQRLLMEQPERATQLCAWVVDFLLQQGWPQRQDRSEQ